jgi:hypothetical protein
MYKLRKYFKMIHGQQTALGSDYRQKIEQTCFTASPIATNRSTILSVTSCGKAFAKDAINENP